MKNLISEIALSDSFPEYKFENNSELILKSLSKINIFIGTNNSGKSRLLRRLLQANDLGVKLSFIDYEKINFQINELREFIYDIKRKLNLRSFGEVFDLTNSIHPLNHIYIEDTKRWFSQLTHNLILLKQIGNSHVIVHEEGTNPGFNIANMAEGIRQKANEVYNEINKTVIEEYRNFIFLRLYIPALRGLRTLSDTNSNQYLERTSKDYLSNNSKDVEIFTGLEMYEHCRKLLLGNLEDREKVASLQRFLSNAFFDEKPVAIIPSHNSDVISIKIGDEKEQPIFNLGDGIQSLIIFTFPLFLYNDRKLLMFIEEPELYLHPGLQRKLIEIFLRKEFENVQFFFATHSNHLLDLTLDYSGISVYSFLKEFPDTDEKEKLPTFSVKNISNPDSNLLATLGVKNSSVFLSNCSIWVEGITDRLYLRKFLKLFLEKKNEQNEIREDIHYSFIEYSGNNITHWSFLDKEEDPINYTRITNKIFLIADKDNGKEERHEKLKAKLGDNFICYL